jgi:quinol monooxygenase YgiN
VHAVLITFRSSAPVEQLEQPFKKYAEGLRAVPGFISKTWISDGDSLLGGFYVFTNRADADAFLGSEMVAGVTSNPAFKDFQITHYDVLDELSVSTGTPTRQLGPVG